MPTSNEFRDALRARFQFANHAGRDHVDIVACDPHRDLGGYPGPGHQIPTCCTVRQAATGPGDRLITGPPSKTGTSLMIRFALPRRSA